MSNGVRAIDADGHIMEHAQELRQFLAPPYDVLPWTTYSPFPSLDGWIRGFGRPTKEDDPDAATWIAFLDRNGIEESFLYPTGGLAFGLLQDGDFAVALARAYNRWVHHYFMEKSPRLKALALLPVQRPTAAVEELRFAVEELGMPGGVLPSINSTGRFYGRDEFHPIYAEAERLGVPLATHGAPSQRMGLDFSDSYIMTHTLEHPLIQITQFTSMMYGGVFELFPRLRVAFLEAGIGWVPFMMDRMDEEFERRGQRGAQRLTKLPSAYVREGNLYFTCEVEEKTLPMAIEIVGEDRIFFASDYPHERRRDEFGSDIPSFVERQDITAQQKDKILYQNARRFYTGAPVPAAR